MRCPVCNEEFSERYGSCPGCGYSVNSGSSQHTPVYRQPESFLQKPAISQSNKANPKTVVAVVLIIITSVLGIFIYRIGKLNAHKQFDFGDFTIELPSKMKEVEDSKFVSLFEETGDAACAIQQLKAALEQ